MRKLRSTFVGFVTIGLASVMNCTDAPSLRVTVTHGEHTFVLTETQVDVYESETLTCDNLRFGKVTLDTIAPFRITNQNTLDQLEGLPRKGHIVVVAKGYVGETIAMIGCNEVDEIKSGDTLAIETKPAALVSTQGTAENNGNLSVRVTVTDIANKIIEKVPVHWTLYGPAEAKFAQGKLADSTSDDEPGVYLIDDHAPCLDTPTSPDCTGGLGRVNKTITAPDLTGPFAVRPRVEWALTPSTPLTQFAGKPLQLDTTANLFDFNGLARVGNGCTVFRPANQVATLFCFHSQSPTEIRIGRYTFGGNQIAEDTVLMAPAFPSNPLIPGPVGRIYPVALVADSESVYLLARNGRWKKIFPLNNDPPTVPWGQLTGSVAQAVYVPACGTSAARVAVLTKHLVGLEIQTGIGFVPLGSSQFVPLPVTGTPLAPDLVLQSGGCVTNVGNENLVVYQSLLATSAEFGAFMGFEGPNGITTPFQISRVSAAGYASNVGPSGDQRILTAEVDISGAVVQESVLSTKTGNGGMNLPALLVRRTLPSVALPSQIRSALFDDGDEVDLAWLIPQERTSLIQVVIDRPVGADRLSALYQQNFVGAFDTGNFDDKGATDIVSWGVGDHDNGDDTTTPVFRVGIGLMSAPR